MRSSWGIARAAAGAVAGAPPCLRRSLYSLRTSPADEAAVAMDWSWEEPFCGLKLNWYPGHMVKAQRALKERVKQVDMIVEVRDARVPLSSANPDLDLLLGEKPRLIVLNKKDLADARSTRMVLARLRQEGKDVITTNCKTGSGIDKLLSWALGQRGSGRFRTVGTMALVAGMPNCGKSTLINAIRGRMQGRKAEHGKEVAKVGSRPGVTRHVSSFRVGDGNWGPLYMLDSPGVMVPHIENAAVGLRLGLTAAIPDKAASEEAMVDYMLSAFNHSEPKQLRYVSALGLSQPCYAVDDLLWAVQRSMRRRAAEDDEEGRQAISHVILRMFRDGKLGKMTLDKV